MQNTISSSYCLHVGCGSGSECQMSPLYLIMLKTSMLQFQGWQIHVLANKCVYHFIEKVVAKPYHKVSTHAEARLTIVDA